VDLRAQTPHAVKLKVNQHGRTVHFSFVIFHRSTSHITMDDLLNIEETNDATKVPWHLHSKNNASIPKHPT